MDELKGLVRDLDGDVKGLRTEAASREKGQLRRDRRRDTLLAVLIVAVLAGSLFVWRFVAYSNCTTDRSRALTGPGNERVTLFLGAFTASVTVQHLSPAQRASDLAVLRQSRKRYPLLPTDAALAKMPDAQIAGDSEAVQALDKNREYNAALKRHPVCTLWGI